MESNEERTGAVASRPAPGARPASEPRPVVGLLLAAGGGRRLGGRPKALLPHDGRLLVEHAAEALRTAGCARVHIVLGAAAEEVRARAELPDCVLVDNPEWEEGMGSSLRAGLGSLAGTGAGAALVALVDQPGIGPRAMERVLAAYTGPASLASATYEGMRGHPVLLGADLWEDVAATAHGDRGRARISGRTGTRSGAWSAPTWRSPTTSTASGISAVCGPARRRPLRPPAPPVDLH